MVCCVNRVNRFDDDDDVMICDSAHKCACGGKARLVNA